MNAARPSGSQAAAGANPGPDVTRVLVPLTRSRFHKSEVKPSLPTLGISAWLPSGERLGPYKNPLSMLSPASRVDLTTQARSRHPALPDSRPASPSLTRLPVRSRVRD